MCGITGYIGKQGIDEGLIRQTLDVMRNRGPDNQQYLSFQHNGLNIALLHARLSIIDLDKRANQPFSIGEYSIIYNGEIYNYIELRERLQKSGIQFSTTSDTEVLLQSYIKYGTRCVELFEGMWSFAIYDKKKGVLFLSRDRFAEKPLYFCKINNGIYFGSEIKFIKLFSRSCFTVNTGQMLRYLINGYKSLYKKNETFFNEIEEVPYATNLTIDRELNIKAWKYWEPKFQPEKMTIKDAVVGVREKLLESVRIRLRSDVPLAFCLSGGIDSASLLSIAVKEFGCDVASFSIIEDDERYNEYDNIMATINDLNCKHTLIRLQHERSLGKLRELIRYHDVPVATITYYIHSLLSEAISGNGYRVAFSGTAADELFTGYYDHFILHLYEMKDHPEYDKFLTDWREHIRRFIRNPILRNPDLYLENPKMRKHIYDESEEFSTYLKKDFIEPFTEQYFCDSLLRNRMMNELFHEATRVILHEDDLNSMKYSVENRSPYLDSHLFDFAFSIPAEYLIVNGFGKYILREAMAGILNDKVRLDRQKKGFNASIDSIINLKDSDTRDYLLEDSAIFEIIKKDKIESLIDQDYFPNSHSKFMFSFINAKMFYELNDIKEYT